MTLTPPEASDALDADENTPLAVSLRLAVLKKRRDFLRAARARRQGTASMMVQMRDRRDDDLAVRVGFTCSKKVGNAVARNRAKRRLREIARALLPEYGRPGHDYVFIARDRTTTRNWQDLLDDAQKALITLSKADSRKKD